VDNEGFMMAIDRLEKGQDEIKVDVKEIKNKVSNIELNLYSTTQKVKIHDEEIKILKKKVDAPREEVNEVKYHGYFWFVKQWFKMKPLDKIVTLLAVIVLLLVIYFIPDLFRLIGQLL